MKEQSNRSGKAVRNIMFGTGAQVLQSIFPFVTRTVFIHVLGEAFLGVSGLFTSILSVLSLAELGIGKVVVFSLYEPLAKNDKVKLCSYVKYYRTIYRTISLAVFAVGMMLIPFLGYLVNLPSKMDNILLYYILYVINSAASYLFVYKTSIINADQKGYIVSLYTTVSMGLMNIGQCAILILFRNFTLYLLIQLFFTIALNVCLSHKADALYNIKLSNAPNLSREEKKDIITKTKAMLSYKLGGVFLNSTDSVYISTLVNTITVGFYTNYTVLENFLNKFVNIFYDNLISSVGNLNVTENEIKKKSIFNVIMLLFGFIGSVGFCGFFLISSDIIDIWIGEKYRLEVVAVLALAIRFYMPIILYPVWMYRNATGLFTQTRSILLYAGIANLILSFFLGKLLGLAGILFATSISRLCTSFWFEPVVLYKKLFPNYHVKEFFLSVLYNVMVIIITVLLGILCINTIESLPIRITLKILICVIVPFLLYLAKYNNKPELLYLIEKTKEKIKRRST